MSFRARKCSRFLVEISHPLTGVCILHVEAEWGDEIEFIYTCHKCNHEGATSIDGVKSNWYGKKFVPCEACGRRLTFDVATTAVG